MTFLLPLGLAGLLLLPVIALLHLIQRRRDRMRVPSLQIWRDLQRETVQQKPRRIPLTLLLLLHLLLAALLALALGQPLLEAVRGRAQHVVIVLDTSTSMAATDEQPTRFAAARQDAERIIAGLRRGDSAALIELSGRPRIVAQGSGGDTVALRAALGTLRAGGPDGDLAAALSAAQATAIPNAASRTIVLTDRSIEAPANAAVAGSVEWRTFGGVGDNVAIVAFASRPLRSGAQQLYARVANLGTTPIARTLQLDLDGSRAANEPMRLAPGAEAEWSWPLPAGTERAEASLSGADIQPLDDRAAVTLANAVTSRVILVSAGDTPVQRALAAQRGLAVERVGPEAYQAGAEANLFVFVGNVPAQLPDAPVLLIAPPADQQLIEVGPSALPTGPVTALDERFAAIDWRPVTFESVSRITPPAWASVAVAQDGLPLVLTGQLNNHPVVVWAFDPAGSNLPNRLAFPLLTAATTTRLLPQANSRLALGDTAPFALSSPDGRAVAAGATLTEPGIYRTAAGDGQVAVNALDADEATLKQRPAPTIAEIPQQLAEDDTPVGRELWQPLVLAALVVLIGEWLYSNRASFGRRKRQAQV